MLSFTTFKKIAVAAVWAGLFAGLLLTVVQQWQVIPALLHAEVYEEQAVALTAHGNNFSEANEWQPENGWQRTFFTALANITLGIGFALLMGAAVSISRKTNNWRRGLIWGIAGYVAFFLAPTLGLPPEVPGMSAAKLEERQVWWIMTVFDTALGLWLLVFSKVSTNKLIGGILLITPHWLITAPHPVEEHSAAPQAVVQTFITATVFANAVFWLSIGALMGKFYQNNE